MKVPGSNSTGARFSRGLYISPRYAYTDKYPEAVTELDGLCMTIGKKKTSLNVKIINQFICFAC